MWIETSNKKAVAEISNDFISEQSEMWIETPYSVGFNKRRHFISEQSEMWIETLYLAGKYASLTFHL